MRPIAENYKTVKKEIQVLNIRRDILPHGLQDSKLLRYILSNLIYRFNTTAVKISVINFVDINKLILKFIWNDKNLEKLIKYWKTTIADSLPDSKTV